ncbi:MAG: hypothetical protein QM695_00495 [Micropruina sp.]
MDLLAFVLGVVLAALALWVWGLTRRSQADEIFDGITPGLTPAAGTTAARVTVSTGEYRGEIAVAFNPPRVRAGLAGAVVHCRPETRDIVTGFVVHSTAIIAIGLLTALWPVVQQVFLPKATLRTAEGTAVRIRMLGFKTYLETA